MACSSPSHESFKSPVGKGKLFGLLAVAALAGPGIALAQPQLVPGEIDGQGDFIAGDWIEMRDDGNGGDGAAGDGVYTAQASFEPSASQRTLGYLVIPPGGTTLADAIGLISGEGGDALPVPVEIPAATESFVLEVRFTPDAPEGFGPSPSIADSWNTGFSLDSSLRREAPMVVQGSFQDLLGTEAWDPSSQVTVMRDDGAFGDLEPGDGIATFAFISPVGIDRGEPGSWRVAVQTEEPEASALTLAADGWAIEPVGTDFHVEMARWMPARFEVDLLRGMARVTEAPELLDLPMISQMSPRTNQGTYIDVMNTADAYLALEGVYLGDDRNYFLLPDPPAQISRNFDFNVTFPAGAWIAPSSAKTVTVTSNMVDFASLHGEAPDYVIDPEPTAPHHMRLAYTESVRTTQRGLTDGGEYLILYSWAPGMPLMEDLDVLVWGDDAHLLPLKTGLTVGVAEYGADAGTVNVQRAPTFSSGDPALWRVDFRRDGLQRFFPCGAPCALGDGTGYNGVFHHGALGRYDATDQDLTTAAGAITRSDAVPGEIAMLSLAGMVEDEAGTAIEGVTITLRRGEEEHSIDTSAAGAFSVDLPHGTWRLSASAIGYSTQRMTVRVDHHKTLAEPIVMLPATTFWIVSGVVTALQDGSPIAGATIEAIPGNETTETDELGEYSLELLEGIHTIWVSAEGFRPASHQFILDDNRTLDFELEPTASPVRVSGLVERAGDGEPIADATVTLDDQDGYLRSTDTAADGSFEFLDVPADTAYLVTVQASGYQTYQTTWHIADEDVVMGFELVPGAGELVLTGQVSGEDTGAPIQGAAVEVELPNGVVRSVATNAQGAYSIGGLSPGTYDVAASATGYERRVEQVEVLEDTDFDFVLTPAASTRVAISGTVALEGLPAADWAGSTVTLTGPSQRSVLTGAGGSFMIGDLAPGSYTISASRSGFETASRQIEATENQTVDFALTAVEEDEDVDGCDCSSTRGGNLFGLLLLGLGLVFLRRRS